MRYFEMKKARIEIIPMIDIMLFLLVFFIMVTLSSIPDSGIASHLPTSSTSQTLPPPKLLINLAQDGTIQVKHQTLSSAELTAMLSKHDPAHIQVTIAGAKGVSLQKLINVMDACRKAGVANIGLAARSGSGS